MFLYGSYTVPYFQNKPDNDHRGISYVMEMVFSFISFKTGRYENTSMETDRQSIV